MARNYMNKQLQDLFAVDLYVKEAWQHKKR